MNKVVLLSQDELREMLIQAVKVGVGQALSIAQKNHPQEMSDEQAGEYLGISPFTLRMWRSRKKGPKYHKNGRLVRYSKKDLDAWLETNKVLTIDSREGGFEKFR